MSRQDQYAAHNVIQQIAAERDALRVQVQAVEALVRSAQGSYFFGGGWDPGILSVVDVAAALGIGPNGPPLPPTEDELQQIRGELLWLRLSGVPVDSKAKETPNAD